VLRTSFLVNCSPNGFSTVLAKLCWSLQDTSTVPLKTTVVSAIPTPDNLGFSDTSRFIAFVLDVFFYWRTFGIFV